MRERLRVWLADRRGSGVWFLELARLEGRAKTDEVAV